MPVDSAIAQSAIAVDSPNHRGYRKTLFLRRQNNKITIPYLKSLAAKKAASCFRSHDHGKPILGAERADHLTRTRCVPVHEQNCASVKLLRSPASPGKSRPKGTYSTLLRALGTDVKVQQELLRHADISTTLNVYTQAVSEQKREAASRVVRALLKS